MRFLPLKIAFFDGFENDNILSSKSYTGQNVCVRDYASNACVHARIFTKFLFGNQHLSYKLKFQIS